MTARTLASMRLMFAILFCVVALTRASFAQSDDKIVSARFGIGTKTCATWLLNKDSEAVGNSWVLGYWSGLNTMNLKNHGVGDGLRESQVLGEIKRQCLLSPAATVGNIVEGVYVDVATGAPRR
jgi:hypothetical protein